MSDVLYNSVDDALIGLKNLGLDTNNISINNDTASVVLDTKYVTDNSADIDNKSIIINNGDFSSKASILKKIKAGNNIVIKDNNTNIEIIAVTGSISIDALGSNLPLILPENMTLDQLIGDFSSSTSSIHTIISDIQNTLSIIGSDKSNVTYVNDINTTTNNLINVNHQQFLDMSSKLGNLIGFNSSSTLVQNINNKATITSVNTLTDNINLLTNTKLDIGIYELYKSKIGNLTATTNNNVAFNETRNLIDTIGNLDLFDNDNTLISSIGDVRNITNNGYMNLIDYIDTKLNIINNDVSTVNTDIGNLDTYNDMGINLIDVIGNPSTSYLTTGSLNISQIIDFSHKSTTPDNEATVLSILVKYGKVYDVIPANKTFVDILGDFKDTKSEFINIRKSIDELYDLYKGVGSGIASGYYGSKNIIDIIGPLNETYNILPNNNITSKIKNIEKYIENNLGFIDNINDISSNTINNSRRHLLDIIGDVNLYSYDDTQNIINKDKYYPLFSIVVDLYTSYTECKKYISDKINEIDNIITNVPDIDQDDLDYLNNIKNNIQVGIIYNNGYDLDKKINNLPTDIYVYVVDGFYVFKDTDDNIISNQGETLKLSSGRQYKFIQQSSSNIPHPIGFSYRKDGTNSINDQISFINMDTLGSGLNMSYLTESNYTGFNPSITVYEGYEYILESNTYVIKNTELGYKNTNKVKLYTDIELNDEIDSNNLLVSTYNSSYSATSVKFTVNNIPNNDGVLYYGFKDFMGLNIYGVLRFSKVNYPVTYRINEYDMSKSDYVADMGTNFNRYALITPLEDVYIYSINNINNSNNQINSNNLMIVINNSTTDLSLNNNISQKDINTLKSNNIVLTKWVDNNNHLYIIPYIPYTDTNNYKSVQNKYTSKDGSVFIFNLNVYYNTKSFDIISDINNMKFKLDNIYTAANDNLSNLVLLGDVSGIYNNSNKTLTDVIGLPSPTINTSIVDYISKIGPQSIIENNIPNDRNLIETIGNLNNYNSTNNFIDLFNCITTNNTNFKNSLPDDTSLDVILGNLSSWDSLNKDSIANLIIKTGKINVGPNTLNVIFDDLSLWDSATHDSLSKIMSKIGKINMGSNYLNNILGDLSTWDISTNDTISKIVIKTGKINLGVNTLENIFGDLSNWISTTNETLGSLLTKTGKIKIGPNKLNDILGDLSTWNTNGNDTYSDITKKIGKYITGTNTLGNVTGDLSTWDNTKNETISNLLLKTGLISVGNGTLGDVIGDLSIWDNIKHDTISNILIKYGTVNVGSNTLSNIFGDLSTWNNINNDTVSNILSKTGVIDIGDNTISDVYGNLGLFDVLLHDTLSDLIIKTGKINIGNLNTLNVLYGDLSVWDNNIHDTLSNIFSKSGKISVGSNKLSDIYGYLNTWDIDNHDTFSDVLYKLGKINLGDEPYLNSFSDIVGDLSLWNNVTHDNISNNLMNIGKLLLPNNRTLSNVIGDINSVSFTDTFVDVLSKVGLSSDIVLQLPSNKTTLLSVLGPMNNFNNDTISERCDKLGVTADLNLKLPNGTSLINVIGDMSNYNTYTGTNTITKRLDYIVGNTSNAVDILVSSVTKVGNTNNIERSIIQLIGSFNNTNYGYISSSKTLVKSVYDLEQKINANNENITVLNNDVSFINNTLGDLTHVINTGENTLEDVITNNNNRLNNLDETSFNKQLLEGFSLEGYYPLYFTSNQAMNVNGATNFIELPSLTYGPYKITGENTIDVNTPQWNSFNDTINKNMKLYMPASSQITQYIPTINDAYRTPTSLVTPYAFDDIYTKLKNNIDILGENIISTLSLNNNNNLSDEILYINDQINNINNINSSKIGNLNNILSSSLNTLELLIGGNTNDNTVSIYSNILSIKTQLDDVQYSNNLTNLKQLLGDMSSQTKPVQVRLFDLENISFGDINSVLPNNEKFNTLGKLLGNMSSQTMSIHDRIHTIEKGVVSGVVWKQSFDNLIDLNVLVENDIILGWAYYIKNTKDAYVCVEGVTGDYKPNTWLLKSFIKIADFNEINSLVLQEKDRALLIETNLQNNLTNEINRATNKENNIQLELNNQITTFDTYKTYNNVDIVNIKNTLNNEVGDLSLILDTTLEAKLGNLTSDSTTISDRLTKLEKKIGIKDNNNSDFTNDELKLPLNKTLKDFLGGSETLSLSDFNNQNNEPNNVELSTLYRHDDVMTLLRKIGRLSMGLPNITTTNKRYTYTLSEIIGNLKDYDLDNLGNIVNRLLNIESTNNALNTQITSVSLVTDRVKYLNNYVDYFININNLTLEKKGKGPSDISILRNINRSYSTTTILESDCVYRDNIYWLQNSNKNNNTSLSLAIVNTNTSNYLSNGCTVCFHASNITGNINNLFSIITSCKTRMGVNRLTEITLNLTSTDFNIICKESDDIGTEGNNLTSTLNPPNYPINNSSYNFSYGESNLLDDSITIFFCVVLTGYMSDDYSNTFNENLENKGSITFYYKKSNNKINKSTKWIPFFDINVNVLTPGNLSKFMDNNSWFIFGGKSSVLSGNIGSNNYFSLNDYASNNIEKTSNVINSNCDICNITVFNKSLNKDEIIDLSEMLPDEYNTFFTL